MIETSWFWRRAIVFAVLVVGLGLLIGLAIATTIYRVDTALARDIAGTAGLMIMSTVGTYVAGAAWDDRNRMIHGRTDGQGPPGYPPAGSPPVYQPPSSPAPAPAYSPPASQPPPPMRPGASPATPAPAFVDDGQH
jgi:hypothetical protein